jgi:hypothetical protein
MRSHLDGNRTLETFSGGATQAKASNADYPTKWILGRKRVYEDQYCPASQHSTAASLTIR